MVFDKSCILLSNSLLNNFVSAQMTSFLVVNLVSFMIRGEGQILFGFHLFRSDPYVIQETLRYACPTILSESQNHPRLLFDLVSLSCFAPEAYYLE